MGDRIKQEDRRRQEKIWETGRQKMTGKKYGRQEKRQKRQDRKR